MGWSSWSFFRDHPTEAIIKAQADALVANGLPALGYRYVNIDDGWSDGFDDHGIPKPNLTRFPSGMDGMAKYMHQHGLLFGIYPFGAGVPAEPTNHLPCMWILLVLHSAHGFGAVNSRS